MKWRISTLTGYRLGKDSAGHKKTGV